VLGFAMLTSFTFELMKGTVEQLAYAILAWVSKIAARCQKLHCCDKFASYSAFSHFTNYSASVDWNFTCRCFK